MNTFRKFSILSTLVFFFLISILTGCGTSTIQKAPPKSQSEKSSSIQSIDYKPDVSTQSVRIANKVKGVDNSVAVAIDKDISIALKVTGFQRFRLRNIKQEVQQQVKKGVADSYKIHITTDKKLYQSLETLKQELNKGKKEPDHMLKHFKKINDDMHG